MSTVKEESTLGHLIVIIQFLSKEDAVSAYESDGFQKIMPLRTPYTDMSPTNFEGI